MSTKSNTHYIRGKGYWMKVLGDPVDNYAKDGKEWVLDLTPDADGVKLLKKLGLSDRIKNKGDERGDFITFKQRAVKANGEANRPINVVDAQGRAWPKETKLGNGTDIDLKFNVRDYGPGKREGVYPQAIRVLEAVEYIPQDFAPLDEEDRFFRATPEQTEQFEEMLNNIQAEQIPDPFDDTEEEEA